MPKVQIGAAIVQSVRFIGTAWQQAWGILLITVWLTATIQAIEVLRPEWGFVQPLGLLLTVAASTAMVGALYRIGVEAYHPGDPAFRANPAGLQWGALEWRVLGANIIIGLILGAITVVAFIVWAIALGVTAGGDTADLQAIQGGDQAAKTQALLHVFTGPAGVASVVILIPALCVLLYLGARWSLFTLAAADTGAFSLGRAWALTQGAVLTIIVTWILIFLTQWIVSAIVAGGVGIAATSIGQAAISGKFWGGVAGQAAGAALSAPLFAGLQLYVYQTRRGGETVAATFT